MRCLFVHREERCETDSGDLFICPFHRRSGTRPALERMWEIIRDIVLIIADTGNGHLCYHCGKTFPREAICIDHFPHTKDSIRSEPMWRLMNYVPSCQRCNTSGSKERQRSIRRKTLLPWQLAYCESRFALGKGIEELGANRDGLRDKGIRLPPIHEHIELLAIALVPLHAGQPEHLTAEQQDQDAMENA